MPSVKVDYLSVPNALAPTLTYSYIIFHRTDPSYHKPELPFHLSEIDHTKGTRVLTN